MKRILRLTVLLLVFPTLAILGQVGAGPGSPEAAQTATTTGHADSVPWAAVRLDLVSQVTVAAFVSALVAGLFLLGGYYYRTRLERKREEEQAWQRIGIPLVNSADDLIARIFDVVVRERKIGLDGELVLDPSAVVNPPKSLSTVWRLVHYLAACCYLEQQAVGEGPTSRIANLRYYATNKARIPLKGNMYSSDYRLQTEGQQLIGSKVLSLVPSREIRDVNFFRFLQCLRDDEELRQCADACRQVLNFKPDLSSVTGQFLSVAHFVIHLIDMVQDLRPTSKWEEFRLFLAALLRSCNRRAQGRTTFLYRRGDLAGGNYLDTYNMIPQDKSHSSRRVQRIMRRAQTGFDREISASGVVKRVGNDTHTLNFDESPGDLLKKLQGIFT
jgi:hypothetical protein